MKKFYLLFLILISITSLSSCFDAYQTVEELSGVVSELESILKSDIEHTILMDDARVFNVTKGYPTLAELHSILVNSKFVNSTIKNMDDIIRIELKKIICTNSLS